MLPLEVENISGGGAILWENSLSVGFETARFIEQDSQFDGLFNIEHIQARMDVKFIDRRMQQLA